MKKTILISLIILILIQTSYATCSDIGNYSKYTIPDTTKTKILDIGSKIAEKHSKDIQKYIDILVAIGKKNSLSSKQKDIVGVLRDYFVCKKGDSTGIINDINIEGCTVDTDPYHFMYQNIIYELLKNAKGEMYGYTQKQKDEFKEYLKKGGSLKDGIEKLYFRGLNNKYKLVNYLAYYYPNTNQCSYIDDYIKIGTMPINTGNPPLENYDKRECNETECILYKKIKKFDHKNGCTEDPQIHAKYGGLFTHGEFLKRKIFIPNGVKYLQIDSISKFTAFNTGEWRMNFVSLLNNSNNIVFDLINNIKNHISFKEGVTIGFGYNTGAGQYIIGSHDRPINEKVFKGGYLYIDSALTSKFNYGRQENITFAIEVNKQDFIYWFYNTPIDKKTGLPYIQSKKIKVKTFPKDPHSVNIVEKEFCIKGSGDYKIYKNIDDYLNDFKFLEDPKINSK